MSNAMQTAIEFFTVLGNDIATQDNRASSEPIYQVVLTDEDGDRVPYAFFTEKALREHLAVKTYGPNFTNYVESGYLNPEWKQIRHLAMSMLYLDSAEARKVLEEALPPLGKLLLSQDTHATSEPVYQVIDRVPTGSDSGEARRRVNNIFLTEQTARQYMAANEAKLHSPSLYVESGRQNPEWIQLRRIAMAVANEQQAA